MKKETLSSISERTGLSVTTVSRILSGNAAKYRISRKTAELVTAEAKRCGYVSPSLAQNLRTVKSKTVGLLLPSVNNPYFADMARVIITELDKSGFMTIVVDTMESESKMVDMAAMLARRNVDGIIAVPCGESPAMLERLDHDVPVVLVDRYYPDTTLSYVTTNNYRGAYDATSLMISRGYRDIACIQGERSSSPNVDRVKGYLQAMEDAGLGGCSSVVGNDFTMQNGYLETKLLISGKQRPRALFALSNTILLGVVKALREASISIPDDMAVISFDDNMYMDYMTPPITRVGQPVKDMASLATKILLGRIANPHKAVSSQLRLLPEIISGGSI